VVQAAGVYVIATNCVTHLIARVCYGGAKEFPSRQYWHTRLDKIWQTRQDKVWHIRQEKFGTLGRTSSFKNTANYASLAVLLLLQARIAPF